MKTFRSGLPKSTKKSYDTKVGKVMHEFKAGTLNIGKSKKMVSSRPQAIAIALSVGKKMVKTHTRKMKNGGTTTVKAHSRKK